MDVLNQTLMYIYTAYHMYTWVPVLIKLFRPKDH